MATSWSTFPTEEHPREWIRPGDEVSASDFDNKEEYDELVAIGAIRDAPYPIPQDDDGNYVFQGSPREYAMAQLAAMQEGAMDLMSAAVQNTLQPPQLQEQAAAAMDATEGDKDAEPKPPSAVGGKPGSGNAKDK